MIFGLIATSVFFLPALHFLFHGQDPVYRTIFAIFYPTIGFLFYAPQGSLANIAVLISIAFQFIVYGLIVSLPTTRRGKWLVIFCIIIFHVFGSIIVLLKQNGKL